MEKIDKRNRITQTNKINTIADLDLDIDLDLDLDYDLITSRLDGMRWNEMG